MGETFGASLVALVAAAVVALWNVGGRAALERRTIRQEPPALGIWIGVGIRMALARNRASDLAAARASAESLD